jgi:hypothetical protein
MKKPGLKASFGHWNAKNLFRKLNVTDRVEVVREATHRGFLYLD